MGKTQITCSNPTYIREKELQGMAFDGRGFLLLDTKSPRAVRLGTEFQRLESFRLGRKYTSICFDPEEQCYWAVAEARSDVLYRLDPFLNEAGRKELQNVRDFPVCGLTYDSRTQTVWLAFPGCLGYCRKKDFKLAYLVNKDPETTNTGILWIPTHLLAARADPEREYIELRRLGNYGRNAEIAIPGGYTVAGMSGCGQPWGQPGDGGATNVSVLLREEASGRLARMDCSVGRTGEDETFSV